MVILLTCTYIPISRLIDQSVQIRKIGSYLNQPTFQNDSINQLHLQIEPLYYLL